MTVGFLLLFISCLVVALQGKQDSLEVVTHKVFFDVEIDGTPAGEPLILVPLCDYSNWFAGMMPLGLTSIFFFGVCQVEW